MVDHFTLTGAEGELIRGDLYLPERENPPLVIVLHGFKGFKDWGFFPWLGQQLADGGLAAACVNLSHCGIGENPETFERLDLFERDTWGRRMHDIRQVRDAAAHGLLTDKAEPNAARLGLLGHSMGGAAALLSAAKQPGVGSLATLACAGYANRIPDDIVDKQLRVQGFVAIENARTGQLMRIGREFFEELRRSPEAFDVRAAAAKVDVPWLLVHGADDETVPLEEARMLVEASNDGPTGGERTKFLVLDDAGHTFGAVHPFKGPTQALEQATAAVVSHFQRTL
jgi:uncharacterized protein